MKVLIESGSDVLESTLNNEELGVLFILFLLKNKDTDIALMKAKKHLKFQQITKILITLQDEGFIEWSGYLKAVKRINKKEEEINPQVEEILKFLGDLKKQRFAPNKTNTKLLIARLSKESVEDIKAVITNRFEEWKDTDSWKYFRPQTLFRKNNFDKYLDEVKRTGKGRALLQVKNIGLKEGDEITKEISLTLMDRESYEVKIYIIDHKGKLGIGNVRRMLGKAIKKELRLIENRVERGEVRDLRFLYQGE